MRGLLIDYLWLRAIELRNKGSHYEIVQLYNLIGKLEPRIPEVWSFTAWEMAYNISITMPTPEERWRWIYKAIEHLRDYGIQYNKNTPKLYWELGFLICDKLEVDSMDEYKAYYQLKWYYMWENTLGSTSLEKIAQAPLKWKDLLKDNKVKKIYNLFKKDKINIYDSFINYKSLSQDIKNKIKNILKTDKEASFKLIAFLKAKKIREVYKMDPKKMVNLIKKYGIMDWRRPSTHALYWGEEGKKVLEKIPELKDSVLSKNIDRICQIALKQNFEYGRIIAVTPYGVVCIPNFSVLDSLNKYFETIQKKWGLEKGRVSHKDFLIHAIKKCYMYNQRKKALKYFKYLKSKFKDPDIINKDLDTFIVKEIGRTINFGRKHIVEDYIVSQLIEAYISLINGIPQKYDGLMRLANLIYKRYLERHTATEDLNKYEKPKTFSFLRRTAIKIIRKNLEVKYGKQKSINIWKKIEEKFPLFKIYYKEKVK